MKSHDRHAIEKVGFIISKDGILMWVIYHSLMIYSTHSSKLVRKITMGFACKMEWSNHREAKHDKECWWISRKGGIIGFLKRYCGHDEVLSRKVAAAWEEDKAIVGKIEVNFYMEAIATATKMSMEGRLVRRKEKVTRWRWKPSWTKGKSWSNLG